MAVRGLAVRDNVPAGGEVSLAGISELKSFAALFRDELRARGLGGGAREKASGRERRD